MVEQATKRCEFCWHPAGGHHNACPMQIQTEAAKKTWAKGWERGFADDYNGIKPWQYSHYDRTFILGYRVGQHEMEMSVDTASQERV